MSSWHRWLVATLQPASLDHRHDATSAPQDPEGHLPGWGRGDSAESCSSLHALLGLCYVNLAAWENVPVCVTIVTKRGTFSTRAE